MPKSTRTREVPAIDESEVLVAGDNQSLTIRVTEDGGLLMQLTAQDSKWAPTIRLSRAVAQGLKAELAWMI